MDVFECLYNNSVRLNQDKQWKAELSSAKNQVNQHYRHLCRSLTEDEIKLLNKIMKCSNNKAEQSNIYCFKEGFKAGFNAAVKSMA